MPITYKYTYTGVQAQNCFTDGVYHQKSLETADLDVQRKVTMMATAQRSSSTKRILKTGINLLRGNMT